MLMIQANTKDPRTHSIIGAAMEVYKNMGPGFFRSSLSRMSGNRIYIEIDSIYLKLGKEGWIIIKLWGKLTGAQTICKLVQA
jgi:hypothetical protein